MTDTPISSFIRSMILDLLPMLTVLILILMTLVPHTMPATIRVGGLWPLIGISFWTLVRPRSMSLIMIFLLGVTVDIVTFVPLGMHASVFVISQVILRRQRRFLLGQGFWVLWAAYALLALSAYTLLYILISMFLPSAVSFMQGLIGAIIAWACLPLIVGFLSRIHDMIDLFEDSAA